MKIETTKKLLAKIKAMHTVCDERWWEIEGELEHVIRGCEYHRDLEHEQEEISRVENALEDLAEQITD